MHLRSDTIRTQSAGGSFQAAYGVVDWQVEMEHLERLIIDLKESLEREIKGVGDEVKSLGERMDQRFDEVNARFDTQNARLERHAGLLQTGSRWTNRMNEWAEKVDSNLARKDKFLADLSDRLRKLEEGRQPPNPLP